jgi:hypothetical protein
VKALLERAVVRDLYDVDNIVRLETFVGNELTLLRKCAALYFAITGDVSADKITFDRIEDITRRKVLTDLQPMLRNKERFDLQSAKERVGAFLEERMALTDGESEFLKRFRDGIYEPWLLFDDSEIVRRIEKHPMAMWRIQNTLKAK